MIELYQAEWCPASHRVREQLTELDVDYVVHQVPAERAERDRLLAATGADTIPALRLEDGAVVVGEESIANYLRERFVEPAGAKAHRLRAAKAHRRTLEEECECPPTPTP